LLPTKDWIEQNFRLPAENSDTPGKFDFYYCPAMIGITFAVDAPEVEEVYCMKSAQICWTTWLIAVILSRIDQAPVPMIGMFSAELAARDFSIEKLKPFAEACPAMDDKLDVSSARKTGNGVLHRQFPGGFLKLVGSNAARGGKSTPAGLLFVEEPDDAAENMQGQGDSVAIFWERDKGFEEKTRILGGTPTIKNFSRVEDRLKMSDQCVLPVACHSCGEKHVLDFANVTWLEADSDTEPHEVYGLNLPETALYSCPFCGDVWDDHRRKQNIRDTVYAAIEAGDRFAGWTQTKKTNGRIKGFMGLSELYNCLNSTKLQSTVEKHLEAEYFAGRGDQTKRISFVNNQLGKPYEFQDDRPDADHFRELCKEDEESQRDELICPNDGLMVTVGIDVQHNRVAVGIRAWGRDDRSWGMYWGEISATTSCTDKNDGVWDSLDKLVFQAFKREDGGQIFASAISIDSSDGATSDAVYEWVRSRQKQHTNRIIMAVKGSSSQQDPEIFTQPKVHSIDHKRHDKKTKAQRHGVKVFIVGTNKAKDWIAAHMVLDTRSGGYHYYRLDQMRWDYFDQMTGEAKIPHKTIRNRRVWTQKNGQAVEAWDCEVYALHAARARRVHLLKDHEWDGLERQLRQNDLFKAAAEPQPAPKAAAKKPQSGSTSGDSYMGDYKGDWV
jgi:phage terminase large subunit GpA-like protein